MNDTDTEMEELAFRHFATVHPHEAYETWPERFWAFFHEEQPEISREVMEQVLKETAK